MNTKIKYLGFKGVEKKEQILFKSYLNLAKNELDYQLVVLSTSNAGEGSPDILIADSAYEFAENEQDLESLPMILIGNDIELDEDNYLSRPVQWSDFKRALASLSFVENQAEGGETQRLLPDQMRFAIAEIVEENSVSVSSEDKPEEDVDYAEEHDLELGSMSVDYHSHTNSEYMKAAEEVKDFKDAPVQEDLEDLQQAVVLVTDEESTSVNSVLVIETDSLDIWDMDSFADDSDEAESNDEEEEEEQDEEVSQNEIENARRQAIFKKLEDGEVVSIRDEYWASEGEIYCDAELLFIMKPDQELIYSSKEPAKWGISMRNRELIRLPLDPAWTPGDSFKAYPLSRLEWANSMATNYRSLVDGVELEEMYMLQSWPDFDLLELDNMLLKLCTMLFVGPESPQSLIEKTGFSRSVVYAFVNACQISGLLRLEDEIEHTSLAHIKQQETGMFNKIKDVFR